MTISTKKQGIKIIFDKFINLEDEKLSDLKLFSSCIGNNDMPLHYKFLNLMYVLDRLASKKSNEDNFEIILTKNDIKHLSILEEKNVPKNTVDFIKARIEKTRFTKLKEKIRTYLQSSLVLKIEEKDLIQFVEITVNTRNKLAHGSVSEPNFEDEAEFQKFNSILENWINLIILKELGVKEDFVISKVMNYRA